MKLHRIGRATRIGLAALLGLMTAALLARGAENAPAAKTKSPWQLLPGAKMEPGGPVLAFGWATNRVWLAAPYKEAPIVWSARLSGRRLTGITSTRVPTHVAYLPIVDDDLVLPHADCCGADRQSTAPLLADGRVGASKVIEDDLLARAQEAAPRVDTVLIEDGVRVGNRVIWALLGGETVGLGGKDYQLVCCTESGAATDLTRFIDLKRGLLFVQLGRDARGRIWLAWLDRRIATHGAVRGLPRILQLDPSTLAPRTKALAIPGVIADKIELACAASCRLVAESAAGDIVSWAPGESSPTRVASGWKFRTGNALLTLLAASYRSGHLVVAYQGAYGQTQFFDASVRQEIRIVRADARGAHGRVVGTIPVANTWPPDKVTSEIASPFVYGTFTPLGLVVIESFQFTPSIVGQSPVPYAIVPVTR